jgi:hypothetical protein
LHISDNRVILIAIHKSSFCLDAAQAAVSHESDRPARGPAFLFVLVDLGESAVAVVVAVLVMRIYKVWTDAEIVPVVTGLTPAETAVVPTCRGY